MCYVLERETIFYLYFPKSFMYSFALVIGVI